MPCPISLPSFFSSGLSATAACSTGGPSDKQEAGGEKNPFPCHLPCLGSLLMVSSAAQRLACCHLAFSPLSTPLTHLCPTVGLGLLQPPFSSQGQAWGWAHRHRGEPLRWDEVQR